MANELTGAQLKYIEEISQQSEQDLFLEIAKAMLAGTTAHAPGRLPYETRSGGPRETRSGKRFPIMAMSKPLKPVTPEEKPFLAKFTELARNKYESISPKIYQLFCDDETLKPKEWANDLIAGHRKDMAIAIISALTTTYNVEVSLAMPIAWLAIKNGVEAFCAVKTS